MLRATTFMTLSQHFNIDSHFHSSGLPVLVTPKAAIQYQQGSHSPALGSVWQQYQQEIQQITQEYLPKHGGILFRGFQSQGDDAACQAFAESFGDQLLSYEFGSTPRTDLGKGVYTATEYPSHQIIPLHNEQAYTLNWPLRIWFHCVRASEIGGETPIADSRRIYQQIPRAIRERFEQKQLLYVRNYGNGLDLPWEKVFNTTCKTTVEAFCHANQIAFEWKDDGELRTSQRCQASATHPVSGEQVWFNQAHLFHISNLDEDSREVLLDVVDIEDLPRNVYYGDGSPIEDEVLDEIRAVLAQESILFPWREGDFLMLDNMLAAHGRSTFSGDRKVVVAMARHFDSRHPANAVTR